MNGLVHKSLEGLYLAMMQTNLRNLFHEHNKSVTAANQSVLKWTVDAECYVVSIVTSGTDADSKDINIFGKHFCHIKHAANATNRTNAVGGRPYLVRMKRGDQVEVVSETAAGGTHSVDILGFYASDIPTDLPHD